MRLIQVVDLLSPSEMSSLLTLVESIARARHAKERVDGALLLADRATALGLASEAAERDPSLDYEKVTDDYLRQLGHQPVYEGLAPKG